MKALPLFCLFALSTGCATLQSVPVEHRTVLINADYETTFKATINAFIERGFVVSNIDKEMGLINTDYMGGEGGVAGFILSLAGDVRTKASAMVSRVGDDKTKVILMLVSERKKRDSEGGWQVDTGFGDEYKKMYDKYFSDIRNRAEN